LEGLGDYKVHWVTRIFVVDGCKVQELDGFNG